MSPPRTGVGGPAKGERARSSGWRHRNGLERVPARPWLCMFQREQRCLYFFTSSGSTFKDSLRLKGDSPCLARTHGGSCAYACVPRGSELPAGGRSFLCGRSFLSVGGASRPRRMQGIGPGIIRNPRRGAGVFIRSCSSPHPALLPRCTFVLETVDLPWRL